jgi:hypothetical protein
VLGDVDFMRSLQEFDKDNIPDAVIKKLRRYIDDPNYQPDVVAKQSRAAMSLCMWTRAMDVYNRCVWMPACEEHDWSLVLSKSAKNMLPCVLNCTYYDGAQHSTVGYVL